MELKKLKIGQLRKMARREPSVKLLLESEYGNVNRAPKSFIIETLHKHCALGELEKLAQDTAEKPVPESLQNFPLEVLSKMIERQVEQGNEPNINVFSSRSAGPTSGGFDWILTSEGHEFWQKVLLEKDFDLFFEKYPNKSSESSGPTIPRKPSNPETPVFKKGDRVRIKSVKEILKTLDDDGCHDSIPFPSVMHAFTGNEFTHGGNKRCISYSGWSWHNNWLEKITDESDDKYYTIDKSQFELIIPQSYDDLKVGDYLEILRETSCMPGFNGDNSPVGKCGMILDVDKENDCVRVRFKGFQGHNCKGSLPTEDGWNLMLKSIKEGYSVYRQRELFSETPSQNSAIQDAEIIEENNQIQNQEMNNQSQMKLDLGIDLNSILTKSIEQAIGNQGDDIVAKQLAPLVKKEVAKLKPTLVKIPGRKDVTIEGQTHKKFKDILFLAQTERQVFLSGPSGSGKTYACSQVAKALSLPFSHISCSPGMSEAHLLGRMLFDGTYVAADFVNLYENGGVFLFDEIDAADAGTLLVINSALANGHMSVPNRKDNPIAKRHEDFICICAGNTWGNGSVEYAGRNYMDAAFMDRFAGSKVMVDYDTELEREICNQLGEEQALEVYNTIKDLRDICFDKKVRKVVSTRAFISAVRQIEAGKKLKQFMKDFTIDWSKEEKAKARVK